MNPSQKHKDIKSFGGTNVKSGTVELYETLPCVAVVRVARGGKEQ